MSERLRNVCGTFVPLLFWHFYPLNSENNWGYSVDHIGRCAPMKLSDGQWFYIVFVSGEIFRRFTICFCTGNFTFNLFFKPLISHKVSIYLDKFLTSALKNLLLLWPGFGQSLWPVLLCSSVYSSVSPPKPPPILPLPKGTVYVFTASIVYKA